MKNEIGLAAGQVWRYLNEHGATSISKLKKDMDLSGPETDRAIGWLAREDKIVQVLEGKKTLLKAV